MNFTMNPSTKFVIGVWAQPNFQYNTKDWSMIPMFPKWVNRGVNLFVTNGINPSTPRNNPLLYCSMAADAGAEAMVMPEVDNFDPAQLVGKPGFAGFMQPDEPEGWNHILKDAAGNYDMAATTKQYTDRYALYKKVGPNVPVYGNFTGNFIWASPTPKPPSSVDPGITQQNYRDWFSGCDWISFDQYITNNKQPVASCYPTWQNQLKTLQALAGTSKPIFNYIETSDYDTTTDTNGSGPTPGEFRAEVWASIILGFNGIIYFPQRVAGGFSEDATPQAIDTEMKRAAKDIASYQQFLLQPSVDLGLAAPFVGCSKTLNGQTVEIVLNLSNTTATYKGRSYPPYEYTVLAAGQNPPQPVTLQTLDQRLRVVEKKLGL